MKRLCWIAITGTLACGGGSAERDRAAARDSLHSSDSSAASAADAVVAIDDPLAGFGVESDVAVTTDERLIPLRLVNEGADLVVVYARGGAEEVLLDSVPAGSLRRVDVLTRAVSLELRAVTPDGRERFAGTARATADSVSDIAVGGEGSQ